jgi:hypothetical protein
MIGLNPHEYSTSKILCAVAKNPHTSADVLSMLARHGDKYVRYRVADHKNADQETRDFCRAKEQEDDRKEKRDAAAHNQKVSEFWERFLETGIVPAGVPDDLYFFASTAHIVKTIEKSPVPPHIGAVNRIAQLPSWRDSDRSVMLALAKHPGTSANALLVLAQKGNKDVRSAIMEHPNANEKTLGYCRSVDKR